MRNGVEKLIASWRNVGSRNRWVALVDFGLLCFAVWLAYALRLSLYLRDPYVRELALSAGAFAFIQIILFLCCGVYRIYWPHASLEELLQLGRAYLYGCLCFIAVQNFGSQWFYTSRTILVIQMLVGWCALLFVRLTWRLAPPQKVEGHLEQVILAGAGQAGVLLARDLRRQGLISTLLGFVDDDPLKQDKKVAGVRVLGHLEKLPELVKRHRPDAVIIAMPSSSPGRIREILDQLVPLGVSVRVLPGLKELADGSVLVNKLRPISLADLLARDPVPLDADRIGHLIRQETVLVTGAGGSIGSEIVRQLLHYEPKRILLLGHGEHSIYTLLEELTGSCGDTELVPVIADVADRLTMERLFKQWQPSLVFHAAAHKHVPLMEYNPREAVRVNSLGTWTVAHLAGQFGTRRFVMISTDKAVNPSSIMGASKRLAETVLLDLQSAHPETAYMAVRFGNVLGSRGSVIPKFEAQIEAGGPVTVTHPDMTRYFMLIPEAAGLVIQAGALGTGGSIYVLDMGKPVKILDLAQTMIRLHGYVPYQDIEIRCTGARPGEKLFEELFYDLDHVDQTEHSKIFAARIDSRPDDGSTLGLIEMLLDSDDTRSLISVAVPEFLSSDDKARG